MPSRTPAPRPPPPGRDGSIPAVEWVVAALGLVVVLGSLGYLLVEAVGGDESPPAISVTVDSVMPLDPGFLVRIRAENVGGSTAAAVVVEGVLRGEGGEERSQATFDYVPSRSFREGGLFFRRDPRRAELELRALGYEAP